MSVPTVREYFFTQCDGFSMYFPTLLSAEGEAFRRECATRGKKITVWTVNDPEEMKECLRWGVQAVITDKPDVTVGLVDQVSQMHRERDAMLTNTRLSEIPQRFSHPIYTNSSCPGRHSSTSRSHIAMKPSRNVTISSVKVAHSITARWMNGCLHCRLESPRIER
jgi:carbon monoxide dehydrogenase subunit G